MIIITIEQMQAKLSWTVFIIKFQRNTPLSNIIADLRLLHSTFFFLLHSLQYYCLLTADDNYKELCESVFSTPNLVDVATLAGNLQGN